MQIFRDLYMNTNINIGSRSRSICFCLSCHLAILFTLSMPPFLPAQALVHCPFIHSSLICIHCTHPLLTFYSVKHTSSFAIHTFFSTVHPNPNAAATIFTVSLKAKAHSK